MYIILLAVLITFGQWILAQNEVFSEKIKENIKSRVDNGVNTGIVVGVITPEGTSFYSYGVKSLKTKEPVDEYSIFEIGSISKTFTGILLADEVVNGKLNLNDPLQNLLPEGISAPTRNGDSIKLVNLANHTSSLPRTPDNFTRTNPGNPYADLTKKQVYEFVDTYELPFDIGSKFIYSNLGMGLLGNVLAAKNKTNYEDLMIRKIAEPLEMENTRIVLTPAMEKELAKGHKMGVEVENWDLPALAGAGAILSNAVDMLKYLAANMGINKSVLYPAMQLSHKPSGSLIGGMSIGLGWVNQTVEGEEIVWHNGGTGGYMTFAGFTKDGEKGVVVLSNTSAMPDDIGIHILNPKSALLNPKPSVAIKLHNIVKEDGINAAVEAYAELKRNHLKEYDFASPELNRLGYQYLSEGKKKEALAIFKLNLEAFPDDWNTNDSYAEALLENKQKEKAIKYYKKSVELNPENTGAIDILKKLGVETTNTKQ